MIERLGQAPQKLKPAKLGDGAKPIQVKVNPYTGGNKKLVGADVFLDWAVGQRDPNELGHALEQIAGSHLQLKMITNRGVKVYPNGLPETFCTDHWRCRFVSVDSKLKPKGNGMSHTAPVPYGEIVALLQRLADAGLNFIKIENLYEMNGERAYSLGQGE